MVQHSQDSVSRANDLAARGQVADAYALLTRDMAAGSAMAAATLAQWRLSGQYIRRDLGEARALFGRATELGLDDAEPIYIALLGNGAGGAERRWSEALERLRARGQRDAMARRQLAIIEGMALDAAGNPLKRVEGERLHDCPRIERFPGFLSAAECSYLIDRAEPLLNPSVVVHPGTGALIRDPVRTSRAAGFPFVLEDPVIHAINRRIAAATATTYEQGEPLQVLSYEPGQEYKLHSDALPPGQNQRILTFLVYLNDDYQGGETQFPLLQISHRGAAGDGLLFVNVDQRGQPAADARHAGLPVTRGLKLLLSKWIREAPLDLSGPPGRPF